MDIRRAMVLTAVAMIAFAANSILCRLALGAGLIDAASFTTIRVVSGALLLGILLALRKTPSAPAKTSWWSAAMLFTYMAFFSFAYLSLDAGTGALILFGAVQLTMFIVALRSGEQFPPRSWAGFGLAIAGLVYLVLPGVSAPDPFGAALMAVAGMAWGFYSLSGRGASDPLGATSRNFLLSVPLVLAVSLAFLGDFSATPAGIGLAVASGALASGCGYAIWYAALPGLSATRAATVQLSVPVIAAIGGMIWLAEEMTLRVVLASAMTLGGVAVVLSQRQRRGV